MVSAICLDPYTLPFLRYLVLYTEVVRHAIRYPNKGAGYRGLGRPPGATNIGDEL